MLAFRPPDPTLCNMLTISVLHGEITDRVFSHALNTVNKIRTGSEKPPAAVRLKLYGLYKQSMGTTVTLATRCSYTKLTSHLRRGRCRWYNGSPNGRRRRLTTCSREMVIANFPPSSQPHPPCRLKHQTNHISHSGTLGNPTLRSLVPKPNAGTYLPSSQPCTNTPPPRPTCGNSYLNSNSSGTRSNPTLLATTAAEVALTPSAPPLTLRLPRKLPRLLQAAWHVPLPPPPFPAAPLPALLNPHEISL